MFMLMFELLIEHYNNRRGEVAAYTHFSFWLGRYCVGSAMIFCLNPHGEKVLTNQENPEDNGHYSKEVSDRVKVVIPLLDFFILVLLLLGSSMLLRVRK